MENSNLAIDIARLEAKVDSLEKRIFNVEQTVQKIEELTLSVQKLTLSIDNMVRVQDDFKTVQSETNRRLDIVERAPDQTNAKRFVKLLEKTGWLIVAAVVGYALSHYIGI